MYKGVELQLQPFLTFVTTLGTRLAAHAGCFLYGEGTLLSILQVIVLAPNLLHLQCRRGGHNKI